MDAMMTSRRDTLGVGDDWAGTRSQDSTSTRLVNITGVHKVNRENPLARLGWMTLAVAFGVLLVVVMGEAIVSAILPGVGDHAVYIEATRRWMAGDGFYAAHQLTGPYEVSQTEILYPPLILPLLAVFSFLPDILWWAVPIAILAGVLLYWRPSFLGWILILACLANPLTFVIYLWGNPGMWFVAFVALGTIYHWPSVFVLIKPTLAPFALVGIRHRSWWIALGIVAVASLAFLPLWIDYIHVTLNARGPLVSPLYSWQQVPLMLTPLIAWRFGHVEGRVARRAGRSALLLRRA